MEIETKGRTKGTYTYENKQRKQRGKWKNQ